MQALGLIEVNGYLAAIVAADAALKAANVQLLRSEKIRGGITTIELIGDVAAVSASVEAGKRVAETLHQLRSSHVIARLDQETEKMLMEEPVKIKQEEPKAKQADSPVEEKGLEAIVEPKEEAVPSPKSEVPTKEKDAKNSTKEKKGNKKNKE